MRERENNRGLGAKCQRGQEQVNIMNFYASEKVSYPTTWCCRWPRVRFIADCQILRGGGGEGEKSQICPGPSFAGT